MLSHNRRYNMTKTWDASAEIPTFALILSSAAAADAGKHVDLYSHKGLLKRFEGVEALAEWAGQPLKTIMATLEKYRAHSLEGKDEFGKATFGGMFADDLSKEIFYAGRVTPVLHYCMGGIKINTHGEVIDSEDRVIPGLRAAGEVTGGVHGKNRLAVNSLLECTVFGRLVGHELPLLERSIGSTAFSSGGGIGDSSKMLSSGKERKVTLTELAEHNAEDDCWISIHGTVYDLTDFAEEHPAGAESIHKLCGMNGTEAFQAVHNMGLLEDFDDETVGVFAVEEEAGNNEDEEEEEECSKCQVHIDDTAIPFL